MPVYKRPVFRQSSPKLDLILNINVLESSPSASPFPHLLHKPLRVISSNTRDFYLFKYLPLVHLLVQVVLSRPVEALTLFYNSEKCPNISSGNSGKRPWKGKDKDDNSSANKKKKQSHNADDSSDKAQSNVVIPVTGKFVSFTGDEEADASDDEDFDRCVNNYTSLSKYTD